MRKHRRHGSNLGITAQVNFAFTLAKALVVLLLTSIVTLSATPTQEGVKLNAQYIITTKWADKSDWDVDTWLKLPSGTIVYYSNSNTELVNLERDDTGNLNDTMMVNGNQILNPLNQETIVMRGRPIGDYTLNVHLYRYEDRDGIRERSTNDSENSGKKLPEPVEVAIQIDQINPTVKTIYAARVFITEYDQEVHVARFSINNAGDMVNVRSDLPESIIKKQLISSSQFYNLQADPQEPPAVLDEINK